MSEQVCKVARGVGYPRLKQYVSIPEETREEQYHREQERLCLIDAVEDNELPSILTSTHSATSSGFITCQAGSMKMPQDGKKAGRRNSTDGLMANVSSITGSLVRVVEKDQNQESILCKPLWPSTSNQNCTVNARDRGDHLVTRGGFGDEAVVERADADSGIQNNSGSRGFAGDVSSKDCSYDRQHQSRNYPKAVGEVSFPTMRDLRST